MLLLIHHRTVFRHGQLREANRRLVQLCMPLAELANFHLSETTLVQPRFGFRGMGHFMDGNFC